MDLTWLNTFIMAAEEGNFRRTAQRLHLAQSTVTLHIQNLESELGTELFDRVGRNVLLNDAGRGFLKYAQSIADSYVESVEYVARRAQGYQQTIRISVATLVATTYLPMWVREFTKLHPETEFAIQVTDSTEVLQNVLHQECDIGIGRIPSVYDGIHCIKLYDDPIALVAPFGESEPVDLFRKYVLFTHNHPLYWDDLLLQLRKFVPHVRTMQVNKVHVSIEWIRERMGVSFLPLSTVQRALSMKDAALVSFPLFSLPCARTYVMARKNTNGLVNKLMDLMMNFPYP
ncbi:LysR family transcriptional regulator [Alicyclobacillus tolerans]|uniref:LysR family transcriptional regulator n=1 Tax=Alicyclobacillus tolerans TaxID=90970 RepID=UPI001F341B41|nr:LysR family transcriptional regulator [Alicyclobacillus tolerans]MCF8565089.1 LysR family transcriptional regulator [Alicyclobacillus tolerans]